MQPVSTAAQDDAELLRGNEAQRAASLPTVIRSISLPAGEPASAPHPADFAHAQPKDGTPGAAPDRASSAPAPGQPAVVATRDPHEASGTSNTAANAVAAALPTQPDELWSAKAAFFAACAGLQQQMRAPAHSDAKHLQFRLDAVLGQDIVVPRALLNAVVATLPGRAGSTLVRLVSVLLIVGLGEQWRHHWLSELRKGDSAAPGCGRWYIPAAAWSEGIVRAPGVAGFRGVMHLKVTIWCANVRRYSGALTTSALITTLAS